MHRPLTILNHTQGIYSVNGKYRDQRVLLFRLNSVTGALKDAVKYLKLVRLHKHLYSHELIADIFCNHLQNDISDSSPYSVVDLRH